MRLDGRFEPLTCLAQALALTTVLGTAAVAWWRASRRPLPPIDLVAQAALHQRLIASLPYTITGPGPYYR